jgi:biopolymer transport protein TolR
MKRKRQETTFDEPIAGVNIVPIIDVTLVLLVVLLVLSPVINIPNLQVELPEAMTKETKEQNVTLSLGADGQMSVDSDIVTMQNLPSMLTAKIKGRKDVVVIVRADKNLPYGTVENFIRTVNRYVGERAIAIATQQRIQKLDPVKS